MTPMSFVFRSTDTISQQLHVSESDPISLAYPQSYDFGSRMTNGISFPSQMRGADAKERCTRASNCTHARKSMLAGSHVDVQDYLFAPVLTSSPQ